MLKCRLSTDCSSTSFESVSERDNHENQHTRPFKCREKECNMRDHVSRAALKRHDKRYHSTNDLEYLSLKGLNRLKPEDYKERMEERQQRIEDIQARKRLIEQQQEVLKARKTLWLDGSDVQKEQRMLYNSNAEEVAQLENESQQLLRESEHPIIQHEVELQ